MSLNYKSLYEDTDSVLSEEQKKEYMKLLLNRMYGTFTLTNYKENDMRIKDFIVLHVQGKPVMVKKEAITVIAKSSSDKAEVVADLNTWLVDDKYDDVIKRLFDI